MQKQRNTSLKKAKIDQIVSFREAQKKGSSQPYPPPVWYKQAYTE